MGWLVRILSIDRPFIEGMVTDIPAHEIGARNSAFAQDGYSPQGVFTQRKGYAYYGTTADVADNLVGFARIGFSLSGVVQDISVDDDGQIRLHQPAGAGTLQALTSPGPGYLPRCVYADCLWLCGTDGETGALLYSGADLASAISVSSSFATVAGQSTISGGSMTAPPPGSFYKPDFGAGAVALFYRIVEGSTSSMTLEDFRASTISAVLGVPGIEAFGRPFPCVSVYSAGTANYVASTNTITGYGSKWSTGTTVPTALDGIVLMPQGATAKFYNVGAVASDTSLTGCIDDGVDLATKSPYAIMRACPFRDVAAHRESLWGSGVKQYPSRVYVSPPGWSPTLPPGFTRPFDPALFLNSENANDFFLDFIDVPASTDTDIVVALLESPNPLLVLKRETVYGIFGSFGGLSVNKIAEGVGCIDIRSAKSYAEGQFWAGEGGVYWYTGGQIRDLTSGKINREWRALTRDFDYGTSDFCSIWIASGHLFVSIITGAGATTRTYVCDLRDGSWQSRFTNTAAKYGFTSRIPGEKEKAFIVGGDIAQGRVADVAPCVDGSGTAKDDAGNYPRLQAYTSSALAQNTGIDGLSRMIDITFHTNVVDAGVAGSTSITPSVVQGGGIANEADATTTLADIDSDTVDRIDRTEYRVSKEGRLHQARVVVGTLGTDTAATKVEVNQIVATFRDRSAWA
jgi:hypothetical protein